MSVYENIGRKYSLALERSRRDTKLNLIAALASGWTHEQFRHWVETGIEPQVWGPHQGVQPPDIRKCGYVVSFGPKYIHTTYPIDTVVGADEIVAHERQMQAYVRHLEESMYDVQDSR